MPIVPPAPGRFSTITGWPSAACSLSATGRAMVSVAEPGVNGTMTRIGFEGNDWPCALSAKQANSAARSDFIGTPLSAGNVEAAQLVDPAQGQLADRIDVGLALVARGHGQRQRLAAQQDHRGARHHVLRRLEPAEHS